MDKFFAFVGKFILVVLLVGGVAYGAYQLGHNAAPKSPTSGAVSTSSALPLATDSATSTSPSASPTKKTYKKVVAGVTASAKLSFSKYEITVLDGWAYTDESDEAMPSDTLTITKGAYQIKIYQAPTGGAMCTYPGDTISEGPSSPYDEYVDITTVDGIHMRRSNTKGSSTFTICAKGPDSYGQPTSFGHISYKAPNPPDLISLTEMDAMIASINKQ